MNSTELHIQLITNWMTTISLFLLICTGLFGSFCNIIIFTSKELKKSSCGFYFFCTALCEAFILSFGGISRLATEHFQSTFIEQNSIFCKIRSYLVLCMSQLAIYLLLMAAIDRCMTTSIHTRYRAFSQLKMAHRIVSILTIFTFLMNIHALIFFGIQSTCIPQPGTYALYFSIQLIVSTGILPDGLTIVFTVWTFYNVKRLRQRNVANAMPNRARERSKQRIETQLVVMMIAQASITIALDVIRVSCYSYYFITANKLKTPYEKRLAALIFQLSNVSLYLNYSKSFYIYTLFSSFFRKIFCDLLRSYYHRFIRGMHTNQINPATET